MKKILLSVAILITLNACDTATEKTGNSQIVLQNDFKVSSSATEIKRYTALKDNIQRQHYILDFNKPLVDADQELTSALKTQGYTRRIKSESEGTKHIYFKKQDTSTIVAVFKSADANKTRLSMSWALTQ